MNSKGAREVTPFLWEPKQGGTPVGTAASSRGLERELGVGWGGSQHPGGSGKDAWAVRSGGGHYL